MIIKGWKMKFVNLWQCDKNSAETGFEMWSETWATSFLHISFFLMLQLAHLT